VVTGQQVTLFAGPLFTILKAATAIRKAKDASISGNPHVPIFWLATEDHDLAEADHVTLPSRHELQTLRLAPGHPAGGAVGGVILGKEMEALLDQAGAILGPGPVLDRLAAGYREGRTLGEAFAQFISQTFAAQGLVVVDASSRGFHALGSDVLRQAIVRADELRVALTDRDQQLTAAGYHSQVLVPALSSSLTASPEREFPCGKQRKAAGKPRGSRIPPRSCLPYWMRSPSGSAPMLSCGRYFRMPSCPLPHISVGRRKWPILLSRRYFMSSFWAVPPPSFPVSRRR